MATTNENKGFYKLSWLQRIGFGSGALAQNLIFRLHVCICCFSTQTSMASMPSTYL